MLNLILDAIVMPVIVLGFLFYIVLGVIAVLLIAAIIVIIRKVIKNKKGKEQNIPKEAPTPLESDEIQ